MIMQKISFYTFFLILFLSSTYSFAQTQTIGATPGSMVTFSAPNGTLVIPGGVDLVIDVKAWGAGGGTETALNKRGGGGGGAYFTSTYNVSECSSYNLIVGQGAVSAPGGDTYINFNGGLNIIVGGGGLGLTDPGNGGTGSPGSVPGGDG